jgi:uncharacterized membrane protein YbhN (UPF0104 family)
MGAFAAAWIVGFLAFFIPSGLGVREVVLIALLPAWDSTQVIGASVGFRVAALVGEMLLLLAVSRAAFVRR